jgi:hypothetical protein
MSNAGIVPDLIPTLFAGAIDYVDSGELTLPMDVSRNVESKLAVMGDTVIVPLTTGFKAANYVPGSAAAAQAITMEKATLTLDQSKRVTVALTDKELSLTPYQFQTEVAADMLEELLRQVNEDIATKIAAADENTPISITTITAANIRAAKKALDKKKAKAKDRYLYLPSDWANDLLEDSEFKNLQNLATPEMLAEGTLVKRYGFNTKMNHAIETVGFAFQKGGVAFAARIYNEPVQGAGVVSSKLEYKGIPIRFLMKYDDNWNQKIQVDILYGAAVVRESRIQVLQGSSGS